MDRRPSIFGKDKWLHLSIAQFRFNVRKETWSAYYADRNGKWGLNVDFAPAEDIADLIKVVDDDRTGTFFG
jgi:hypothetical protein